MSPHEIYKKRADDFRLQADKLQKRENHLSMARLISFFAAFLLFVLLFSLNTVAAVAALLAGLALFIALVISHGNTQKLKEYYANLTTINTLEAECINGVFNRFPDGSEYLDHDHPNSYDLDLFGHTSLFQYINRTGSKLASDMLAQWLKKPSAPDEILLRQKAADELRPLIDWRQKMITLYYENENASTNPESFLSWITGKRYFPNRRSIRLITFCLSAIGIATTIMVICGLPAELLALVITVNFIYYFINNKKISKLHLQVTRSSEMLKAYAGIINLIENGSFNSRKLTDLQNTFTGEIPVSAKIKRLSQLVNRLDTRLNVLVSIPLNILFFWDIHCCLALEKWNEEHSSKIADWFSSMAEFEVLSSFANMSFNNPEWVTPIIAPEYFVLKAENMGHPLIPAQRRINNDINLSGKGCTALITGSNMSGKSTFLRTCGVNTILALAGGKVCATTFTVSHVLVFSSMRISDSLEDNTSSFYAELKRLAAIINESEKNPEVFLLLDEILRGTNSNDRYTGSVALIKQLIGYEAASMVATHDLKLADLSKELPEKIDNYHFDVKIDGEELFFDYKLTPGICTSLNASILMKKMGIKV